MRPNRPTIAGVMAVVALAAVDCLGVRIAEFFAGCWLVGVAMQAGLFAMSRSRGRGRRFWAGFEATGLVLLLAYAAGSQADRRVVYGWAYRVTESIYRSMLCLPPDAFQWCFEHGLVVDPRKPLKVYEVVALFEVAYGLPMLLLACVGGTLAANRWGRHAQRPLATPS